MIGSASGSRFTLRLEFLFQDQSIDSIRVIPRPGPNHAVPVFLVESQGGQIVDGSLQGNRLRPCDAETILGRDQQGRPHPFPARSRTNVDGDDMAGGSGMRHDESPGSIVPRVNRHQCEGSPASNVGLQFLFGIRNSRGETFLVQAPQGFEIVRPEVAYLDGHGDIVSALPTPVSPNREHFRDI